MLPSQTHAITHGKWRQQPPGSLRFDWGMVALSLWLVGGAFVDGWAHTHGKVDTSFFTPWHALFYSGFLAVALYLAGHALRNLRRGYPWPAVLPAGYGLSLLGAGLFWLGGVGDLLWHTFFGIEKGVEALFSPTHLLLAGGVWLISSGPFRAAWQCDATTVPDWQRVPMLVSLACMLSVCTFITQIAHPLARLWGGGSPRDPVWLFQEMGVISLLWDTVVLMSLVLLALRRWTLPRGAFTLVLTLNAMAMGLLYYRSAYPLLHVAARIAAGIGADVLLHLLQPSPQRPGALRLFAFAMPALVQALYFLVLQCTAGLWWSVHLWMGMIGLAGVVGLLLSYLLVPPPFPAPNSA
jgi:hypothetical protein